MNLTVIWFTTTYTCQDVVRFFGKKNRSVCGVLPRTHFLPLHFLVVVMKVEIPAQHEQGEEDIPAQ
jgi:hypothetical protein